MLVNFVEGDSSFGYDAGRYDMAWYVFKIGFLLAGHKDDCVSHPQTHRPGSHLPSLALPYIEIGLVATQGAWFYLFYLKLS